MRPTLPQFDDTEAMAVYADALAAAGDPRGDLIHLQLARELDPHDARLLRAEEAHLARNDRALLGALRTATSVCSFTWRRGYIVQARLKSLAREGLEGRAGRWERVTPQKARLARLVRELLAHESARGLEALELSMPRSSFAREHLLLAVAEVVRAKVTSLRALAVRVFAPWANEWASYEPELADVEREVNRLHVVATSQLADAVFAALE